VVCLVVVVFFFAFGHPRIGALFIVPFLFVAFFFRDPTRTIPSGEGLIVSPADGKVVLVEKVDQSPAGGPATKVSVFMSVFNVHINRSPAQGRIDRIDYRAGRFMAAWNDKASEENERNTFTLESPHGRIAFTQIAGLIARRIVCWKKEQDTVGRGEKVGMIMFGSRVDLYLPESIIPVVSVGARVFGGTTVVGRVGGVQGGDPEVRR